LLAQADPGPGEKIVVAPIDVGSLRHERDRRRGHDMRSHLRTEAYPLYGRSVFPPATRGDEAVHTVDVNEAAIEQARQRGQGGD
jgi:hypothetical protein